MNISDYLQRIDFSGPLNRSLEVLGTLQTQHLLHIPFENLDIHYGRRIVLERDAIFNKLITEKRGGFCYELNGLFFELLREIGFQAERVSARVHNTAKDAYGFEFDHLAVLVTIDGQRYLADVGFGEFVFRPLRFELGLVQEDPRGVFVIDSHGEEGVYRVSKFVEGEKKPEYIFTTIPRAWDEFEPMCHYQQTSPDSHFTQKRLISRPTENGRVTITGDILKITEGDAVKEERELNDEADFLDCLREYFGVAASVLPAGKME